MSALADSTLVYRPMCDQDLEAVCMIEQRIYPFPWTYGNFSDSIISGYRCTVMERSGRMLGYGVLAVAAGESHLLNLSIDADWQGQGFGRALLMYHVDLARSHDARILLLEVRPSNVAARALYASAGFRQISVRRGYYPGVGGREDALLLSLAL